LVGKLRAVENSLQTARESQQSEREQPAESDGLLSKKQVEENLHSTLIRLVGSSFPMADLVRRVFPGFILEPVQALDTPLVRPRATLTFRPSSMVGVEADDSAELAEVQVRIDLFDPPLHIGHMSACVATKAEAPKLSLKKLAAKLGINYMTVKRALDYSRRMAAAGMSEPYRVLHERPKTASRWHLRRRAS
jgi:hypothetical protein